MKRELQGRWEKAVALQLKPFVCTVDSVVKKTSVMNHAARRNVTMDRDSAINLFGRRLPLWLVGVGIVALSLIAYSPYLGSGFACDDIIFINMMEGAIPYNPVTGFWSAPVDAFPGFTSLWWHQAGAKGAFLRPLPTWLLSLLHAGFGRSAFPFHLTMSLLHGLVAFSAFMLLRRLSGRDLPALLAALLFLICDDHGMTVAWIATITDLLCALFLTLALLSYISARQQKRSIPFALSLFWFLLALMSKETAAIYPVIVMAYEFFYAEQLDPASGTHVTLRQRLRLFLRHASAWMVPLGFFAAYMVLYRGLVPPMRNLLYQDPFAQPATYLGAMLTNLPVMFVGLLTPLLPSMSAMVPSLLPLMVAVGLALIVLLLWALWVERAERAVWFALLVFVLALLPGLATDAGERQLYFPSIFGLFVAAWLILGLPFLRRLLRVEHPSAPPSTRSARILGMGWAWSLLVMVLIVPLALLFVYPSMWIPGLQLPEKTMVRSLPLIDAAAPQHVVYLNTNSSFNTFYLPDMYRFHRGAYIDLRLLSSFNGHVSARQVGPQSLELRTEGKGWLSNMFARIVRSAPSFRVGDTYETPLFTVTVESATPDGEDVTQARFDFVLPLDDPALLLLMWDGEGYVRWQPGNGDWQLLNPVLDPWAL
jgi:hypothetical protein